MVGGVVEHDVEVVAPVGQHLAQHAGLLAVAVQPPDPVGQGHLVAVQHRHLVAPLRQLAHEREADVPVAAEHQDPHRTDACTPATRGGQEVPPGSQRDFT